jgi:hypothetical protein
MPQNHDFYDPPRRFGRPFLKTALGTPIPPPYSNMVSRYDFLRCGRFIQFCPERPTLLRDTRGTGEYPGGSRETPGGPEGTRRTQETPGGRRDITGGSERAARPEGPNRHGDSGSGVSLVLKLRGFHFDPPVGL